MGTWSPSKETGRTATWSSHYEKKKSSDSLEKLLTSRTLSPPPETLPRKFSRFPAPAYSTAGRLARHPELPPLSIEDNDGPKLKDYLEVREEFVGLFTLHRAQRRQPSQQRTTGL